MNQPLTAAVGRQKRKEMVRLRMELYRQQIVYNAEPLHNPLGTLKEMVRPKDVVTQSKGPLVIGATLLLSLFGKRLGPIGRLARIGLAVYPFVKRYQTVRHNQHAQHAAQQGTHHPYP
ncbi:MULTISPECIES: hypothetical protein [Pseudomonas]|jgi:hypothetical protein|uniref:Uncharacterized protein n=2 Tax=Pseudomonas TaxID=286 RepID=A0A2X2CKB3_PSELU|nr:MULTISPECIES: hypothetical protein [Pseudomonas]ENA36672.1 hypothetical protein HMPREF1487_04840 [Pseudomonas sp. HPB0071]MBA1246956.1 hypothetical protein [Pseudomonas zeshuii]MBF8640014.1 hypothetical protein [Pseudomonas zeshuii]MBH3439423.1 hypothetical protein [Pseudomonas luteola]MBW5413909.1 hypothetical protein [Pseudomonas sp. MAG002Y]